MMVVYTYTISVAEGDDVQAGRLEGEPTFAPYPIIVGVDSLAYDLLAEHCVLQLGVGKEGLLTDPIWQQFQVLVVRRRHNGYLVN